MTNSREALGIWLIGARGSVATTTVVGAAAVAAGLAPTTGLVTALPGFAPGALPDMSRLVFGGHDVTAVPLVKQAERLAGAGVLAGALLPAVTDTLLAAEDAIRPGVGAGDGPPERAIEHIQADLAEFVAEHDLGGLVVINCATTEAPVASDPAHDDLRALREALAAGRPVLPASSLYAYGALDAGWAYVDFTPSTGARLPALAQLAEIRGVPHAGRDGKTGETLVKAALAAMFADRNLDVRSWSGTNLLGGGDGASLADAGPAESKRRSKRAALDGILGPGIESDVHIGHVAELGEWKTAWDLITFEGFLGARMRLQFTWEGADSALAAPLVLDLARLMLAAQAAGESGAICPMGFFFKEPPAGAPHRLDHQLELLLSWARDLPAFPGPGS
ncbi:MAG: inositol-3-phosphate synthase [Acidimicrobiia bacterium]